MIAILAAMEAELAVCVGNTKIRETLRWNHAKIWVGDLAGKQVVLAQCGVGKVLSAVTAQKIISDYSCDALLFIGIAGGVNPDYNIGDVLVAEDCAQWDLDTSFLSTSREV